MNVSNDIAELQKVIVHRPGSGVGAITPSSAHKMLYDDIVYLQKMQEEHDLFTDVLKRFLGDDNVISFGQLLADVLESNASEIIEAVKEFEGLENSTATLMQDLEPKKLAEVLITGIYDGETLLPSLPNLIFTRDLGTVIKDHVLICYAHIRSRQRESLLTNFVITHHSSLKGLKPLLVGGKGSDLPIEGGDVMLIDDDLLLIGYSERTTIQAARTLSNMVLEKNLTSKVGIVHLPKARYCMHLDTVLTRVGTNDVMGYDVLTKVDNEMPVEVRSKEETVTFPSVEAMMKELMPEARLLSCGKGVKEFAEREQWTDGCNLVTVKPGVALAYDRNVKTIEEFRDNGYTVIDGKDFVESHDHLSASNLRDVIITIPSAELSRARGGPHCMTFPISRV